MCHGNLGQNESLERIDRTVDWEGFRRLVQEASTGRRRAGPAILLDDGEGVAAGAVIRLSDPQMEEALRDRISFRRFVGLDLQDHTPDHSTSVASAQRWERS